MNATSSFCALWSAKRLGLGRGTGDQNLSVSRMVFSSNMRIVNYQIWRLLRKPRLGFPFLSLSSPFSYPFSFSFLYSSFSFFFPLFFPFSFLFPFPFLFLSFSCAFLSISFPIPCLFLLFSFPYQSFSVLFPFPFLFLSLSYSFPFEFLYSSFSFSLSSLMWILWSRCEASPWETDKRRKNDNMWKKQKTFERARVFHKTPSGILPRTIENSVMMVMNIQYAEVPFLSIHIPTFADYTQINSCPYHIRSPFCLVKGLSPPWTT